MDRINPKKHKVGARLLVIEAPYYYYEPREVVIVAWSPSGEHVKLQWPNGNETWKEPLFVVEVLMPVEEGE